VFESRSGRHLRKREILGSAQCSGHTARRCWGQANGSIKARSGDWDWAAATIAIADNTSQRWSWWSSGLTVLQSSVTEPLDLYNKHKVIRRIDQECNEPLVVRAEM
jgi:hypothetical protein